MLASASKIKLASSIVVHFGRDECPTQPHLLGTGETTKRRAKSAFVSRVSPVSPQSEINRWIQKGKTANAGRAISRRRPHCDEAGETGSIEVNISAETTGARHTWDSRDHILREFDGDKVTRRTFPSLPPLYP